MRFALLFWIFSVLCLSVSAQKKPAPWYSLQLKDSTQRLLFTHEKIQNDTGKNKKVFILQKEPGIVEVISLRIDTGIRLKTEKTNLMGRAGAITIAESANFTSPNKAYRLQLTNVRFVEFNGILGNVSVDPGVPFFYKSIGQLVLRDCSMDTLKLAIGLSALICHHTELKKLDLNGAHIYKKLLLNQVKLEDFSMEYTELPDTVAFIKLKLNDLNHQIDLTKNEKPFVLFLSDVDLSKFNLPLDRVEFIIGSEQTYEKRALLYQQLLKRLEEAGLSEKFEQYDKQFKELKLLHEHHPVLNFFNKYWWDYGYDKGRVIINSLIIYLIFILLNIFVFEHLSEVYQPARFQEHHEENLQRFGHRRFGRVRVHKLTRIPSIVLYTTFLFWGLKLDVEQIKIRKWAIIMIIMSQYLIGIVCLAYIANYVLTR